MKIGIQQIKDQWKTSVFDDRHGGQREYLSTMGVTPKEAISWLVRAVYRLAMRTADTAIAMGLITAIEVDNIVDKLDDELHAAQAAP